MKIEDVVNLTDGELVNSGYITEITSFEDDLKRVKRECLFISNDREEVREAILNGAYAILYSKNLDIIDDEIAWIKVEDLNEALLKLLKYKLIDKTLYITNEITLQIIKLLNKDKRIAILDELKTEFLNDNFVYITSVERIKNISINLKPLEKLEVKVLDYSIFDTTFVFKDKKYTIFLPFLYFNEFREALYFFENLDLNYHIKDIYLDRFFPQFINSRYEKVGFGRTEKVVIQGIKKDKYFIRELNYIFEKIKYANVKFFDKTNLNTFFETDFNFGVLIDCDVELKEKRIRERNLF